MNVAMDFLVMYSLSACTMYVVGPRVERFLVKRRWLGFYPEEL